MRKRFWKTAFLMALLLACTTFSMAQVSTSGRLVGTVSDPSGAVIAGAEVTVKDDATGTVITTKSGADGTFVVSNLRTGSYTVTVTMSGFRAASYQSVKIGVGTTYDLTVKLEVGEVTSSVVIEAGAEVLETQQTFVGTSVTGRAITQLPFTSRDTLDLAVMDPGAQTTGAPRGTTFNGLPQGAINITLDGLNVQANDSKSSDGFFTMIRPRTDSIEEFSISTAAQGAEKSSEGAVQIAFETKRGGNEYHGGVWWYHRNDFFNANYFFNNQGGIPRQRMRLNQYGYKAGGPLWKEKLFFFTAFDFYKKPDSQAVQRTILTNAATSGMFTYSVGAVPGTLPAWVTCDSTALTCTADVLALAAANSQTNAVDTTIAGYLSAMNSAVGVAGVGQLSTASLFQRVLTFNNQSSQARYFPDIRLDYNLTKSHQLTAIYHYQDFNSSPDLLNNRGPSFPVAPFNEIISSQLSTRNSASFQWRWNVASTMSNEARFGIMSVPSNFFGDQSLAHYPQFTTGVGNLLARPSLPGVVSQPFLTWGPFTRNYALGQFSDNFGWSKGAHNMNFGFAMTEQRGGFENRDAAVGGVTIGMSANDPAFGIFGSSTLPGIPSSQQTAQFGNARNLYALLTGRVTAFTSTVYVNNDNRQFTPGSSRIDRVRQTEFGFYGTDNWRLRPTLTVNYGLRWEYQGAPEDPDNLFYNLVGEYDALFGVSGRDNLFMPGTLTGSVPMYTLNNDRPWYRKDWNNLAPNLGLAWRPNWDNRMWKTLFGDAGKTVFRAAYSITYTREGLNNWISIANGNPGSSGQIISNAVSPTGPITAGQFAAGSVFFSSLNIPNVNQTPMTFGGDFTIDVNAGQAVNVFAPDLSIPVVQSWSVGIQREIGSGTVLEVRYTGNHGTGLWRQDNINEINIFENGFLSEFNVARTNLAICRAVATCTTPRFSNQGLSATINGVVLTQQPVPILTAAFTASQTGSQTASGFSSGGNIAFLDNGLAGAFANNLNTLSGWTNLVTAGFAENFWMANPHARGGAFRMYNGSHSTYNALQMEMRRRPSKGLQFNANYTYSKSLTNLFADSSVSFNGFDSLRDHSRNKGPSPFDLRHTFKAQTIYELSFGRGRKWSSSHTVVNHLIEGWEFSGITRWQSGSVFQVTSGSGGTVNANDPGVELVGITAQQLQGMLDVRTTTNAAGQGVVFYFPASLLNANSTANTAFIRPCSTPGQWCQRLFLYGPDFFRADWSITKRTRITETANVELRAEFLNAFNNINFIFGRTAGASIAARAINNTNPGFGVINSSYQDISTTDDPGGRIVQLVLRVNF